MFPGRPGGVRDEPLLDMLMERRPIPPGAPLQMHDLARILAAAAGPAEPGELAGEAAVLAAFTRQASPVGISPAAKWPARRWLHGRPARGRLPMTAALVAAAAGLGSITAAYIGVLPGPIQQAAHVAVGAPSPGPARQSPGTTLGQRAHRDHGGNGQRPVPSSATAATHGNTSSQSSQHARKYGAVPRATCSPEPGMPKGAVPRPGASPSVPEYGGWTPPSTWPVVCKPIATPAATPRR